MTARTRLEKGIARGWPLPPSDVAEVLSALDAAEAECARLRGELAAACAERDEARAVVAGRTVPTPEEIAAHASAHPVASGTASNGAACDTSPGLWLCVVDGEGVKVLALAVDHDDAGSYPMAWSGEYGWCGTGDIRRAWPLAADGVPCARVPP